MCPADKMESFEFSARSLFGDFNPYKKSSSLPAAFFEFFPASAETGVVTSDLRS
jgi:hypothetical protein